MYEELYDTIQKHVHKLNWYHIDLVGIDLSFDIFGVHECVYKHLHKCTKNGEWSREIADHLENGVKNLFYALLINKIIPNDTLRLIKLVYSYVEHSLAP